MIAKIEKTAAYNDLDKFQKDIVMKRSNRLQIEDELVVCRTIGYINWEKTTKLASNWRKIVKELYDDLQLCESCEKHFDIETMTTDAGDNWFCPECWEALAPDMQKEYEELLARGEIEED